MNVGVSRLIGSVFSSILNDLVAVKELGLGGKSNFSRFRVCRKPPNDSCFVSFVFLLAAKVANVFRDCTLIVGGGFGWL